MHPRPRPSPARLALACLGVALLLAGCWLGWLQQQAQAGVAQGLQRALLSFATARVLHGALSLAQGTAVAIEPVGVGVSLAVGQVLAPVSELVGQFSSLMLAASVSFGVQRALIEVGGHALVSALLSALALAWLLLFWRGHTLPWWLRRVFVMLLLVKFAVPLASLGSELLFTHFLQQEHQAAQASLGGLAQQAGDQAQVAPPAADQGIVDRVRRWLGVDIGQRLGQLRQWADSAVEQIIRLCVVFLLQTLVLPLLLLWGLVRLAQGLLLGRPAPVPDRGGDTRQR